MERKYILNVVSVRDLSFAYCTVHSDLVLLGIYRLIDLWYTCVNMFCLRLNGTRIDDVSLTHLGNSLSSNATFTSLTCVAIFSYAQNSMKTFFQFLCDPSLLKEYGIFFQGGHMNLRLKLRVALQIFLFCSML